MPISLIYFKQKMHRNCMLDAAFLQIWVLVIKTNKLILKFFKSVSNQKINT